jgi:hypothetical protein
MANAPSFFDQFDAAAYRPMAPASLSFADKLAAYFKACPNQWIDGTELETVAGKYAWRSRVSDVRRAPYNLQIENRQTRRVSSATGEPYTISEYRYVPQEPRP